MEKPLVTIIVVSYNHSKYINENLSSIKNQTYNNIQLIVGDDASSDNSAIILEKWLHENNFPALKNIHQTNTGLATMLNECVALADGKYIKIIAADDFLHPKSIEKCVEKLESLSEEFGMVFTDTYAIDDTSKIISDIADYNKLGSVSPQIFRKELIKANRIAALTVLMTKEALLKTGDYQSNLLIEDYYRWLKINESYYISYIPEKLSYYRVHQENTSKINEKRIDEETLMLQIIYDIDGNNKKILNSKIQKKYLSKHKFSPIFIKKYKNYPFKIIRLSLALQYKIPTAVYSILNKIF